MTVTRQVYTETLLRADLRDLARVWDRRGEAVRELTLAALTDPTLPWSTQERCTCGKCLQCVWEAYRHDLALLDGLRREADAEPRDWHDVDEDLAGGPDPEGEAIAQVEMLVAGHEDLLIYGPGGKAGAA